MVGRRHETVDRPFCGCWFSFSNSHSKRYLPQVKLTSHTVILATTSRTVLCQAFENPLNEVLGEVSYTFPLYDGVSVADFRCTVAGRSIVGVVKERNQARAGYQEALRKGQTAGLLEQDIDAADVFTTSIGNVPVGEKVQIEITYLGELKNDAETDGARFTIPTHIAPRYGVMSASTSTGQVAVDGAGMKITVDFVLESGVSIRGIQSSSHPIAVTMGRTSTMMEDDDSFENNLGSATLALGSTELDKDFLVVVLAKGQDMPRALLETHPTLPNQRAIMTTLVPKFNLPSGYPEIVFVVDRSGSMGGKMHLVIEALKIFLKSLPVSVKFNICSFGSRYSFLFEKSQTYDAASLQRALDHLNPNAFSADYGGTIMLQPVKAVLERRYEDLPLEVMLLTDGQIGNQDVLFKVVNEASTHNARFFTLGIGSSASSSPVEGIARAGRGFSQWVNNGERIDKGLVRMLKGALTPHIKYKLEVRYAAAPGTDEEDDFEIAESFEKSLDLVAEDNITPPMEKEAGSAKQKKKISLFDTEAKDEPSNPAAGRYDHLPSLAIPNVLQVPHYLPELYPHSRSTVYLLFGPDSPDSVPTSVTLLGTSDHGDLELEIPIHDAGVGSTIHQLAAKKAMQDLEEGRGWLTEAYTVSGRTLKSQNHGIWDLLVEREAVRLGTTFQIGGKFCSFIAVDQSEEYKDVLNRSGSESCSRQHQGSLAFLEQQKKGRIMMARAAPQPRQSSSSTPHHFSSNGGVRLPLMTQAAPPSSTPLLRGNSFEPRVSETLLSTAGPTNSPRPATLFGQSFTSIAQQAQFPQQWSGGGGLFGSSVGGMCTASPLQPFMAPALAPPDVQVAQSAFDQCKKDIRAVATMPMSGARGNDLRGTAEVFPPSAGPSSAGRTKHEPSYRSQTCYKPVSIFSTGLLQGWHSNEEIDIESVDISRKYDIDAFLNSPADNVGVPSPAQKAGIARIAALSPLEKMQKLIDLQSFSGSWAITQGLLTIVTYGATTSFKSAAEAERAIGDQVASAGHGAIATVLAIAWLKFMMGDEEGVWDLVVEKGKGWLEGIMDGSEAVEKSVEGCRWLWKA